MQAALANGVVQVVGAVSGTIDNTGVFTPGGGAAGSTSTPYTVTQTVVAVGTGSGQVIAANPNRRYLGWMVVGSADVTVSPGAAPAVVSVGQVYQASGVGKQGGSEEFPHGAPSNAFQCIAGAAGSSLIVWEGV